MQFLLVFIGGLVLGALLNVVIIRLPREKRLLGWPRCTRTGEPLAWLNLLPMIGWALQGGRARNGKRLHWIYPLIEALTATTLTLLYARYGFSPAFFYLTFVSVVLIITGAIDWLHRFIYTFIILGATVLALVFGRLAGMNLIDVALGALVAGGVFTIFFMLARVMFPGAGVPFGLGDVYLGIFIGAAVGLGHLASALFYGMLMAGIVAAGIIVARRLQPDRPLPQYLSYGTYLCLGVIVYTVAWGL